MRKKCFLIIILHLVNFIAVFSQSYVPEKNNTKFKTTPAIPLKAYSFNLKDVQLLEGSAFKNAMDRDAGYLLSLDPNRLLHRFYKNAKLSTKGDVYGGWESEGVSGHTMGHYLSACSMMYASSSNPEFKNRVDYIVDELEICQQARKTGFVSAIPNDDSIFIKIARGEIKSSGFDLNGGWSPWYVVHKLMAGLMDAYLYADNTKALKVVTVIADWVHTTVNHLPDSLLQKMLKCEWGGMNDVLASIYNVTGNKKYLALSYKFFDDFVMRPLSQKIDPMPGKHSNTNVPKAIGSALQYELTGNTADKTIASFFWETMVHHHSYVIGGNSNYEYCGEPNKLNNRLSDNTCETCNTYNMLKLTRHLFCWQPNSEYADYYERALYNHILASQNPTNGMVCYFVPLRMGSKKQFSDSINTFTCCVGTGMENHSKYQEGIYYQGADGSLYVNLFIPSKLNWKEKGISVTQTTSYPELNKTRFVFEAKQPKSFALKIRKPWWAKQKIAIIINGKLLHTEQLIENGYIIINRKWNNNDKVEIQFPMELYTESIPDNKDRIAFLYGPVVLAGQLGETKPDPVYGIPVLLTDNKTVTDWLMPIARQPISYEMKQNDEPFNATVILIPFYKTYREHYSVYWDFFTKEKWESKKAAYEVEKKIEKEIEAKTIDYFRIGEMQPERDHNLKASEASYTDEALGIKCREARSNNYFSFEMKVNSGSNNNLLLVYIGDDTNRKFDILIDGKLFKTIEWNGGEVNKFYNNEYSIPMELIAGKTTINIRLEGNYGKTTARIFGVRIIKK